jgi:transcriptional regulator with XRE-family HTH domain
MAKCADFGWSEVGQRIRARRLALKKTQQQLAEKAGLTQNAIFRLEAGDTNPQISTLRAVAKALGWNARELVCGVIDSDPRLGDRLVVIRRILESGDEAAIRAMDYGLENAQTVLDRTSGFWDKEPAFIRLGGKTHRRSVPELSVPLKEEGDSPSSGSRAMSASAPPRRLPKISDSRNKEMHGMTGYRLDDAPHLPVGNAGKIALPETSRSGAQHADSAVFAAREDSERQEP